MNSNAPAHLVARILETAAVAIAVTISAVLAGPVLASAQSEIADPIYVVDMQRVIEDSIAGKAARNTIEAEARKQQELLERGRLALDKARTDFKKQSALLSPEAIAEKEAALETQQRELSRKVRDVQEELQALSRRELGRIVEEADRIMAELAKQNEYRFILERDPRFVLYSSDRLDLTKRVVEELDKRKLDL